ncbi:hypothetical protein CAI21_05775 [Alkalilimnicola ehrlichii]|uniref:NRDE family protein n=1 Tax=Alkalilimnicola ehrlichii TaxID=351052 RepID=A0A3E0X0Z7_9GAMM|nr:NRDE family protein [Alkalilimnicola ehrlichii]RFA30553.1 hypothetical protein CAI21_05775 [Alkalilimnicola ehrlichii]RFA38101.1 hypothetical protein CAL65_07145 [Alkalilimnicola ehrlichii]
MCLLLFAQGVHPDYPLVVAANRDEFHARPTAPAAWWPEGILAGRDLKAGGTWLGVSRTGRFAALTNFRDPQNNDPQRASRGQLVVEALLDTGAAVDFAASLRAAEARYNGFNLVFGHVNDGLHSYNNHDHVDHALGYGLYGLSNHLLETPWPKVARGKALLEAYIAQAVDLNAEKLFELLADRHIPPDEALPNTGIALEWERLLAPMFIVDQTYGTRCSTVILLRADGELQFSERSYHPDGSPAETQTFSFRLGAG